MMETARWKRSAVVDMILEFATNPQRCAIAPLTEKV